MKIILAGFPKTGTKSIAKALRLLGYSVFDVQENFEQYGDDWLRIMGEGGNVSDDFHRMYENVDASCDMPICHYWEELYKIFPHAKVILMMRDNEDVWCKSMENQLCIMANSGVFSPMSRLSPSCQKLHKLLNSSMRVTFGLNPISVGKKFVPNAQALKIAYRNHNTRVMQVVPQDKLLVFSCKEGWGPLCRFLEQVVPVAEPFPHENKNGEFGLDENLKDNPGIIKIKREIMISLGFIAVCFFALLTSIIFLFHHLLR